MQQNWNVLAVMLWTTDSPTVIRVYMYMKVTTLHSAHAIALQKGERRNARVQHLWSQRPHNDTSFAEYTLVEYCPFEYEYN